MRYIFGGQSIVIQRDTQSTKHDCVGQRLLLDGKRNQSDYYGLSKDVGQTIVFVPPGANVIH
jgi:hypothetical protein